MERPHISRALLAVALPLLGFLAPPLLAQDPPDPQKPEKPAKRTDPPDDEIWGYGGIGGEYPQGGPPPIPAPIVPQNWLVVPRAAGDGIAELLACIAGSTVRTPAAGDRIAGSKLEAAKWEARRRESLKDVTCAFTRIESEHEEVRIARLSGAALLILNGEGFIGDAERRGFRGVPIALRKGINELYVSGIQDTFELELWSPATRAVIGTWDVGWPEEAGLDSDLTFPVFNASRNPVKQLHVHYGHARVEGGSCKPSLSDWRDGGRMLPLGLRIGASYFLGMDECDARSMEQPLLAPICVYDYCDSNADRQILRWPGTKVAAGQLKHKERTQKSLLASALLRLGPSPLLIYGTPLSLARARFDQESIWYRANYVPEAIDGAEFLNIPPETERDELDWYIRTADKDSRYVIYGNAETNPAWKHFLADDYPIQVHEGRLRVNGKEFTGDDICGWFKLKTPDFDDVLVIADTGARGARLGYIVQPLLSDASDLEYAFWDARGPDGTPRLFGFANRVR